MFITSLILDGFKSYGKRTEISGFDREFTAITGLNGTGKSNVLDSICFVLGISNLGQVRATSLQELIFRGGQSGITKATVTIVFDNNDKEQSPIGYERCREISVTRQIVVGGKNKYLINGKVVLNKKVIDLFCSVQLNINNPNFLIMQGRITKVLNMKPHEILSMIEEAAGTSMYETKRDHTNKMIEKKDFKLKEIDTLLKEEIEPKLNKLRTERAQYVEFQKISRDIEYLTRIYISHKYIQYKKAVETCEKTVVDMTAFIENSKQKIIDNDANSNKIDDEMKEVQEKIDTECGGVLDELEKELTKRAKEEATANGATKSATSELDMEKRKLKALGKSIKDDEIVLKTKEDEMDKVGGLFESLKQADENDSKAYAESQKRFEAISSGKTTNQDGEASSLQAQLIAAKQQISEANTTIQQSEMELKQATRQLQELKGQSQSSDAAYLKDKKAADNLEKEIHNINSSLSRIDYEEGTLENLEQEKQHLSASLRETRHQLECKHSHRFEFQYRDPEPNFDRRRVRGMVCNLFDVRDNQYSLALSMATGSLFNVVVDTDVTSKAVLQRGQLKSRTTMIPMNKIFGRDIAPDVVRCAEKLVGKENVATALSLIEYNPELDSVMKFVFGRTFICKNLDVAKKVTYHPNILTRSVTLDGDSIEPSGTLSGGSRPKGGAVLIEVGEIKKLNNTLFNIEQKINDITRQINQIRPIAQKYSQLKEQLDLREHELNMVRQRLAQTSHQQHETEILDLEKKIVELREIITEMRGNQKSGNEKVKDIQAKLADSKGYHEREKKSALDDMKRLKKKHEDSQQKWKKHEQEYETLNLEITEIRKGIESAKEQSIQLTESIATLEQQLHQLTTNNKEFSENVAALKSQIKQQKDLINSQNRELKSMQQRKEKMLKQNQDLQLDIKKKENEITKLKNENREGFDKIANLEEKYTWIDEDKQYFGVKNTRYDYSKEDPNEAGKKLQTSKALRDTMEKQINLKAMMLLEREEAQYDEVKKRKLIVLEDKHKIQQIIVELDEKKKDEVHQAWIKVNENFGQIFSTLLPGAQAQLVPPDGKNFLLGLTVRVGFGGMWKESLNELSGGQRSLVALSLILAMLKFNPAPLYILDEVDAALDMSHTQNIGSMLKQHFKNSQFIIVSLKDGMFNNANVLFQTKFEDGVSGIIRKVGGKTTSA